MIQSPRKKRTRQLESGVVRYVDHSLAIAKQINIILKKLDKNQAYLADKLGKKESEISKWLRGTHNFTLKTISKIEDVLGESIIVCPKDVKPQEVHFYVFSEYQKVLLKDKPTNTVNTSQVFQSLAMTGNVMLTEDCASYN